MRSKEGRRRRDKKREGRRRRENNREGLRKSEKDWRERPRLRRSERKK